MSENLTFKDPQSVTFTKLKTPVDAVPILRLYCTQHLSAWKLQIRSTTHMSLESGRISGSGQRHNFIAGATLDRPELEALRAMINRELGEGEEVVGVVDAIRTATPEVLDAIRNNGEATPLQVQPETQHDANEVFRILNVAGVGAIWMGETRVFLIQSFNIAATVQWLSDRFESEKVNALIFWE